MYEKLPYEQYFIDTSNDFNKTGKARYEIHYESVSYIYKGLTCFANYEIHYEQSRNVIQINFEETNGKKDWIVNFLFMDKYYDSFYYNKKKITLKVHNGWAAMYKAVKHEIRQKLQTLLRLYPDAEVEIIGWSLGSGQAQLCAQDINFNFGIKPHLFTYGSVNPWKINLFTKRKIQNYLRDCCKEVYNFSDKNDIVTYLPFRIFGFIKIKRVNTSTKFKFFGLFKPYDYHTHYDIRDLYSKIYEKEKVIE